MTKIKQFFSKWIQIAGLMLVIGAVAWAVKLMVIISTDGRIINTGAAAVCMMIGLFTLTIGSTGIGLYFTRERNVVLRTVAVIFSPALMFGSFILFGAITNPLFAGSTIAYAQEEAPIGVAVIVYLIVGYFLITRRQSRILSVSAS